MDGDGVAKASNEHVIGLINSVKRGAGPEPVSTRDEPKTQKNHAYARAKRLYLIRCG